MIDIAALFIAYLLSQFYRSFLAVLSPVLIEELGLDPARLATVAGVWFAAFALAQIPTGLALDRYGPRRTTGWAMLVGAGGGALVFGAAQGAPLMIVGMALIGAGCAPVLVSGVFIFARRFPPARFATLSGAMIGFGSLGNALGSAPLAWAVEAFGWRAVMVGLAGVAAALSVMVFALVRDPERLERPAGLGLGGLAELARMPALWPLLPLSLFGYSVSAGIRGLWIGPYLAEAHGTAPLAVGTAALWMALAMAAGSVCYGPLDRLLGTRKWLMMGGGLVVVACTAALAVAGPSEAAAVALLTAVGFFGATYAVLLAHFRSFVPERLTGRGVTLMSLFGIGGVGLGQFATGAVYDGALAAGVPPEAAYSAVFLFYAVTLAGALAVYAFSRDSRP